MPTRLIDLVFQSTSELSTSGMLLRLSLVACSVFALVHLISLWGTRYGDNNTLSKSLFLSLVFHGCLGLGWATVAESYPRRSVGTEPESVQTPVNFIEYVDSAPVEGTNKLPIFQSGPSASGVPVARDSRQLKRLDSTFPTLDDVASPQMDKAPETKVEQDLSEIPVPSETPQVEERTPELEQPTDVDSKSIASSQAAIDQPLLEARPDAVARGTSIRGNVTRPSTSVESSLKPSPTKGSSTRTSPMVEDGETMTFPSEISLDALPKPQGTPTPNSIRRQASPDPAPTFENVTGTGSDSPTNTPRVSTPRRTERKARPNTQPGEGRDDITSRPSIASNSAFPRTPRTLDDRTPTDQGSREPTDDSPQPNFERPRLASISRSPARAPETYQARSSGQRMSSVLKNGGSEESEVAVENSLKWLASVQERDGRWSSARHGGGAVDKDPQGQPRLDGGKFADSGVTGLVVLSFLGAGYTHEKGPYTSDVRRALDWLIDQQAKNGYLGGEATRFDQNYCHAIATFALAEAYAMQKDANDYPELRNAVRRGVELISVLQNEDGGWRYGRGTDSDSDMSMFGWQLMALKSAVNAGIPVPEKTRRGMVRFLDERGRGNHGGLAGYRKKDAPTPAMTAEALFCRQMFTVRENDAASQEAVEYLRKNLPRASSYDEYYWYYGTLAMHQVDDPSWQEWNNSLRDLLISMQRQQGALAGSWDPRGKWAGIGGRLYSTALSTMCLEVYYRYQSGVKPAESQQ